jgi:hypothetical protein
MDVQAGEASVRSDPSATLAEGVRRVPPAPVAPRAVHQGSFFQEDPYPTFAKTDPTPVVRSAPERPGPARRVPTTSRGLRIAVVVTALAVAAAGATLGLIETGVISTTGNTAGNTTGNAAGHGAGTTAGNGARNSAAPPATHPTGTHSNPLLIGSGLGPGSASYTVDVPAYGLTVATSSGRSWVSVGIVGQKPIFAGIVDANSSQHWTLFGPSQVNVGAGGTTVTITSKKRTQSLNPPSAPFTYNFSPR